MKFVRVEGSKRFVYTWHRSLEPSVPPEEQRERMRRMAESYDEAEHERIVRLALPGPPPEARQPLAHIRELGSS